MSAAANYTYLFPGEAGNGNKDSAGDAATAFTIKDSSYKHIYIYTSVLWRIQLLIICFRLINIHMTHIQKIFSL